MYIRTRTEQLRASTYRILCVALSRSENCEPACVACVACVTCRDDGEDDGCGGGVVHERVWSTSHSMCGRIRCRVRHDCVFACGRITPQIDSATTTPPCRATQGTHRRVRERKWLRERCSRNKTTLFMSGSLSSLFRVRVCLCMAYVYQQSGECAARIYVSYTAQHTQA